ncbi:fatty-acid amide hydrolase 2 [Nephila pilipes]|uniref:Fatty-acid amide hydrolase 2 n=1 Tax=Nephila pilipes TaxID=299642 RepID=A0A8X6MBS9_NEPPI|nr:fatty-acid amide hydrolase 2 [Nephila pilipes]GFT44174.1 fatty-acid amide hydrolase 2 [Nephila pilipes]
MEIRRNNGLGIVSNWGTFPHCQRVPEKKDSRAIVTFVSTGPMCRYAEDLPLLLKVLSNYDKRIKLDEKVCSANLHISKFMVMLE